MFHKRAVLYGGKTNIIVKAIKVYNSSCIEKGGDKNNSIKRCCELTVSEDRPIIVCINRNIVSVITL